ncbi:hypothetical protein ACFQ08_06055 [Streptosporangium algeriense]|uniref:Uncharacterized protein n=1 Tax=Streptosporangium algeriense TaxID=1682748 RepID=A0ABW3DK14_9ACTN
MLRLVILARSDVCPSECRNGQIWNPGSGPYPCPICQGNNGQTTS